MLNILGLSAPLFFVFVATEWFIAKKRGLEVYEVSDAIANMSAGIAERLFDFFWAIILFFTYAWIHQNVAPFHIPTNPVTWFLCLVAYDFLYYWYHRLGHEVNAMWAIHILHHQSEQYNLTVASRQSGLQAIAKSFFFAPLALVGFAPSMAFSVFVAAGAWGFFVHTRLINRLGFLEHFMVTPSLHRVHHGRNEIYLDKNYCGVFIIWDKLFGTYQPETEPVRYGITKRFVSRNAYWAVVHYWVELFERARRIPKLSDRIRLFFRSPNWRAPSEPAYEADTTMNEVALKLRLSQTLSAYQVAQSLVCLGLLAILLINRGALSADYVSITAHYTEFLRAPQVITLAVLITLATFTVPLLAETKRWAFMMEALRVFVTALLMGAVLIPHWETSWHVGLAFGCLVSLFWLAEGWKAQTKIALPANTSSLYGAGQPV